MKRRSPSGFGIYFIDIFACALFALTLTLVSARFGRETQVPIDLPEMADGGDAPSAVPPVSITLRERDGSTRVYWADEAIADDELVARLRRERPPAVEIRMDASPLTHVLAAIKEAGVEDVRVAYRTVSAAVEGTGETMEEGR